MREGILDKTLFSNKGADIFFLFFPTPLNICCGYLYSPEVPHRGTSGEYEYLQHMF